MPTRKMSDLEKLLLFAREATDDELQQALDIINIERRIRAGKRPTANPRKPRAASKPKEVPPGPPNPPKPDRDNPQG
jgi:hypothetical protein